MHQIMTANITIMVKDMRKAKAFYTDVLGLLVHRQWDENYVMLACPGITIGLHPSAETLGGSTNTSIGFIVRDLNGATDRLKKAGVKFSVLEDKAGNFAYFNDPDGTVLYFMEPAPALGEMV